MPAKVAQCIAGDSKVHCVQPTNLKARSREQRTMVEKSQHSSLRGLTAANTYLVQQSCTLLLCLSHSLLVGLQGFHQINRFLLMNLLNLFRLQADQLSKSLLGFLIAIHSIIHNLPQSILGYSKLGHRQSKVVLQLVAGGCQRA